jgi:hypothetical protein
MNWRERRKAKQSKARKKTRQESTDELNRTERGLKKEGRKEELPEKRSKAKQSKAKQSKAPTQPTDGSANLKSSQVKATGELGLVAGEEGRNKKVKWLGLKETTNQSSCRLEKETNN